MNEEFNNNDDGSMEDLDSMFDELDGISSSGDDGGDRDTVADPSKIGNTILKSATDPDKLMENVKDSVLNSMPSPVSKELNKVKEINEEIIKPLGVGFNAARKGAGNFLKTLTDVLPEIPGVSSTLNKIAESIIPKEDEEDNDFSSAEESEDETIKNNVAEVFGEQKAEERVQERLESVQNMTELELQIRNVKNLEILKDYFTVDQYNYNKKSLELQFKQTITTIDLRNRFGVYAEEQKQLLRAIIKNTGLPDMVKLQNNEILEHKLKEKVISSGINLISNSGFVQNLKSSVQDKVIDKLSSFTDAANGYGDMINGVNDSLSMLSPEDKQAMMMDMLGDFLREKVVGTAVDKLNNTGVGKTVIGNFGKKIQRVMADPASLIRNLTPEKFEDNSILTGLTEMLEDANRQEGVSSIDLKNNINLDAPAVFDNKTQKTITNIIPSLLSKIINELKGIRTGKFKENNELRFDFKDNKFKTTETIKKETIQELNTNSENFKTRTEDVSKNIFELLLGDKYTPEELSSFKKGIEKIILDGGYINPIQWYNDPDSFSVFDRSIRRKVIENVKDLVEKTDIKSIRDIQSITEDLSYLQRAASFQSDKLQSLIDNGDVELLRDTGLINESNNAIESDKVKDFLLNGINTNQEEDKSDNNQTNEDNALTNRNNEETKHLDYNNYQSVTPTIISGQNVDLTNTESLLNKIVNINSEILEILKNGKDEIVTTIQHKTNIKNTNDNRIKFSTASSSNTPNLSLLMRPNNVKMLPTDNNINNVPMGMMRRTIKNAIINVTNGTINTKEAITTKSKEIISEVNDNVSKLTNTVANKLSSTLNTIINTDVEKTFSKENIEKKKTEALDKLTSFMDKVKNTELYKSTNKVADKAISDIKKTEAYKTVENNYNTIKNSAPVKGITNIKNNTISNVKNTAEYVKEHGIKKSLERGIDEILISDLGLTVLEAKEYVDKHGIKASLEKVIEEAKNKDIKSIVETKVNNIKQTDAYKDIKKKTDKTISYIKKSETYKSVKKKKDEAVKNIKNTETYKSLDKKIKDIKDSEQVKDILDKIETIKQNTLSDNIKDVTTTIKQAKTDNIKKLKNTEMYKTGKKQIDDLKQTELYKNTESKIKDVNDNIKNSEAYKKTIKTIDNIKKSPTASKLNNLVGGIKETASSITKEHKIEKYIKNKFKDSYVEIDEKDSNGKTVKHILLELGDLTLSLPIAALASPILLASAVKSQVGFFKTPGVLKQLLPSTTEIVSDIKTNIDKVKELNKNSEVNKVIKEEKLPTTNNNNASILNKIKHLNSTTNDANNVINTSSTVNTNNTNYAENVVENTGSESKENKGILSFIKNKVANSEIGKRVGNAISILKKVDLPKAVSKKYGKQALMFKIKDGENGEDSMYALPMHKTLIGLPFKSLQDPLSFMNILKDQVGMGNAGTYAKEIIKKEKVKLDYSSVKFDKFYNFFKDRLIENKKDDGDKTQLEKDLDNLRQQDEQKLSEAKENVQETNEQINKEPKTLFEKAKSKFDTVKDAINNKSTEINKKIKKRNLEKDLEKIKNINDEIITNKTNSENIYDKLPSSVKNLITMDENGKYIVTIKDEIFKVDGEGLIKLLPTIEEKLKNGEITPDGRSALGNTIDNVSSKLKEQGVGGAISEVASDIKKTIIEKVKDSKVDKGALGKTLSIMFNGKNPLKDKLNAVDIAKAFTTGSFKGAFWFGRNVLRPGYKKMLKGVGEVAHEAGKAVLTKGFGFDPRVAEGILGLVEAPFKLVSKAMNGVNNIFKKAKEAFQGFFKIIGKVGKFFLSKSWGLVKKGISKLTGKSEEEIDNKVKAGKDKVKAIGRGIGNKWMNAENSGLLAKMGMGTIRKTAGLVAKAPLTPFKTAKTLANTFIITDKEEENLWLNKKFKQGGNLVNNIKTGIKNIPAGGIKNITTGGIKNVFTNAKNTVSNILDGANGVNKTVDSNGRTVIQKGDTPEVEEPVKTKEEHKEPKKKQSFISNIINKLTTKKKPKNHVAEREAKIEKLREESKQKEKTVKTKKESSFGWKSLLGILSMGFGFVKKIFSGITSIGKHLFKWLPKIFSGFTSLGKTLGNVGKTIYNGIKKGITKTAEVAKKGYEAAKNLIKPSKAVETVADTSEEAASVASKTASKGNWFTNTFDKIKNKASNIVDTVKSKVSNVAEAVKSGAKTAWNTTKKIGSAIKDKAVKIFKSAADVIKHPWNSIKDAVSHLMDTPFVKKTIGKLKTFLPKFKNIILEKLGKKEAAGVLAKLGSKLVPGVGTAMLAWDAGNIAWKMLHDHMKFLPAVSEQLIGFNLFGDDDSTTSSTKNTDTKPGIKPTDGSKPVPVNEQVNNKTAVDNVKQAHKELNNLKPDKENNIPKLPEDKQNTIPPITAHTTITNKENIIKPKSINLSNQKPTPTVVHNHIDNKHTKILSKQNEVLAEHAEKQTSIQEEINHNLELLTKALLGKLDKKSLKKVKTASKHTTPIHKTPTPAPKPAVSAYSSDF